MSFAIAHRPLLRLIGVVVLAGCARAAADPIWAWDELDAQHRRLPGCFGRWAPEQSRVLSAIRRAEDRALDRTVQALQRRIEANPKDAAAHDLLGRAHLRLRRVADAVAQFRAALAIDPAFTSSRLALAEIYLSMGRRSSAVHELVEVVRHDPKSVSARRRLAAVYAQLGRHGAAAEQLAESARLSPDDVGAQLSLAQALLRSGHPDRAQPIVEAALSRDPEARAFRRLLADCHRARGDWEAAAAVFEALCGKQGDPAASERLGLVRLHQRKFDAARRSFQEALDAGGRRPLARVGLGVAEQGAGQLAAAAAACGAVRELVPAASETDQTLSGFVLANTWLAKGDRTAIHAVCAALPRPRAALAPAYDALLADTAQRPDDRLEIALRLSIAALSQRVGWVDEAIAVLTPARKLAPRSLLVGEVLAACYQAAGRQAERLALWEELHQALPDDLEAARQLARRYHANGQPDRAVATCRAVLERSPADLTTLVLLSRIALRRGDEAAATEHARAAARAQPESADAYQCLLEALLAAESLEAAARAVEAHEKANARFVRGPAERAIAELAQGRPAEALIHAQVGLERDAFDPRLRFLAGLALERQDDPAGALSHFEAAAIAEPTFLPAHAHAARAALAAGDAARALEGFRSVLARSPGRLDAQLGVADALSRLGRPAEAIAALRALAGSLARTGGPPWRAVQARLAREHLAVGDTTRALTTADAVLVEQPEHLEAARVAAEAHHRLGDLEAAAGVYGRLVARAPEAPVAAELGIVRLVQGRAAEAAGLLDRASRTAPPGGRSDLLAWLAAARVAAGKPGDARAPIDEAFAAQGETRPPSGTLILILGAAGSGRNAAREVESLRKVSGEVAQWTADAAARLGREPPLARDVLGSLCAQAHGWRRQALERIEAARERAPDEPFVLYLALLRQRQARLLGAATRSARDLVRCRPKSGRAHLLLAQLLDAQGRPQDAVEVYAAVPPLLPKQDATLWAGIAQRLAAGGKIDEAIGAYRTVLGLDPAMAAACNNLAWLYAEHRPVFLADAEILAARAATAQPEVAAFHDTYGWILFLRNKLDDARRELERANALAPGKADYLYHLGMTLHRMGEADGARRLLWRALRLEPKHPQAEVIRDVLRILGPEDPPTPPSTPAPHPAP